MRTTKTLAGCYLYNVNIQAYEKKIINFLSVSQRIDRKDKAFEGIIYEVKRRQETSVISTVLVSEKIVLLYGNESLPKAFRVFGGKDPKDGIFKVFIDCTDIMKNPSGNWICGQIDVFISYLLSAMNNIIYYSVPERLLANSDIINFGNRTFTSLFIYVFDYLFKINLDDSLYNRIKFLTSTYFLTNLMGMDYNSDSVKNMAAKVSKIGDRQVDVLHMSLKDEHFLNIDTFIKMLANTTKISKLHTDNFIEKYLFLFGTGTQFSLELFPSFSEMVTNAYCGAYLNNQKTIEKIAGTDMVEFTKSTIRIGQDLV